MFEGSFGSISSQVCTLTTTPQYVSRRPFPQRELIVRAPITTPANTRTLAITSSSAMSCPKCGTFKKSGRASCCAPGGAWFKMCGGGGNANVDHTWIEGLHVCKGKLATDGMRSHCLSEPFFDPIPTSQHQQSRQQQWRQLAPCALSVVPSRSPANSVVVLLAALGPINVGPSATLTLITRGSKDCRLVEML